jgi:hypothetical protein
MGNEAVDLAAKLELISERWSPKVVARLNDYEVKVAHPLRAITTHWRKP